MGKLGTLNSKGIKERERIYKRVDSEFGTWKDFFYYELYDLIKKDSIFSKLPYQLGSYRVKISLFDSKFNFIKNILTIPIILLWRLCFIRFEQTYYKIRYPNICKFKDITTEKFNYLFVLNTRDHIIAALPVLESLEKESRSLVVIFKGVYLKYKNDFDKLKNAKVLFFECEFKNLTISQYLKVIKESGSKYRLLETQNLDRDLKRLIEIDKNFIKSHLKTELVQYHFFDEVFNSFDIKGVISIVFTTAFEIAKEKNIPTFILQHGIGGKGHGHPYVSDYWFTPDDVSKESLDEWLDHTVNVLALGSPRFEYLNKNALSKRNVSNFNKKIGSPEHNKNVTYISVGTEGVENKELILALKKLRQKLPDDINLIIKLHPRGLYDTKKEIKKTFSKEELKRTVFIKKEIDFYEILANSYLVISTLSTGMQESIAMDIPTLQTIFTKIPYPKPYDFSSYGWREPINDPDVLVNEVLLILTDKERYEEVIENQNRLKNKMFKNFGNCSKLIAETTINICNEKRKIGDAGKANYKKEGII